LALKLLFTYSTYNSLKIVTFYVSEHMFIKARPVRHTLLCFNVGAIHFLDIYTHTYIAVNDGKLTSTYLLNVLILSVSMAILLYNLM